MAQAYQERVVHGVIRSSLYETLAAQGEVPKIAADLANLLAWEIDFAKKVRVGDAFRILIQEALQDGHRRGLPSYFGRGDGQPRSGEPGGVLCA